MILNKKKNVIEEDLVLLGAGHANIEVLRKLGMNPQKGLRVTIISNKYLSTYSGMVPSYIEGNYNWNEINTDLAQLCNNYSHRLIISSITKVDTLKKLVYLKNRPPICYDLLSINLGIQSDKSKIVGSDKFALQLKPISEIKKTTDKILTFNKSNPKNNVILIGAGAAGVEVALALSSRFKKNNIKNNIILLSKNKSILKGYNYFAQKNCKKELLKNNIKVIFNAKVNKISKEYIVYNNKIKMYGKFPILCTAASPIDLLKKSNLPLNKKGSIEVNNYLLAKGTTNIFAAGDIAEVKGYITTKAGVFAVKQGKILFKNIVRKLHKKKLKKYYPQKSYLSLIGLPNKNALAVKSLFSFKSNFLWYLKKYIDNKFIKKYSIKNQIISDITFNKDPFKFEMQCKGCGNKVPQSVLKSVFKKNILNGSLDADKIADTKNLYQSTDIISSIINDPYKLGMLSAKHALNDILASNSKALSSQMIVSMPPALNKINIRDLTQLKKGAEVIMKKSVCDITGGHTYSSNDDQIYIGYSIVGRQKTINKQNCSSEGFVYMTGHIGTAIIFAAIEQKILSGAYSKQVIKEMTASNHKIYELLCKNNVNMITDISGFGLAIHLYNLILRFPRLKGIELSINQVPIYPGVELALSKNVKSSLNDANKNYIISKLNHSNKNHKLSNILYDPQTAGGFVFVVNDNKEKILNDFSKNNIDLSLIGKIKNTNKKITVI